VTADARDRSPLADRTADLERVGARELAFLAQVSLRLEIVEALGPHPVLPPTAPNTWTSIDERELLWLGPDEWLVLGPAGTGPDVVRWLEETFAPLRRSVVDVSANRSALELSGPERLDRLAAGCGLDLHPTSWRNGMCAQTLLARVPVLLQERDEVTRLFVRPSFAGYVVDWLLATAGSATGVSR
jgi:sarcosine oxidase subunit gamma